MARPKRTSRYALYCRERWIQIMAGRDKKLSRGEFVSLSKQIASDWQAFKRDGESGTEILKRFSQMNASIRKQSKVVDGQFFDGFITAHDSPNDTASVEIAEQHLENEQTDGKVLKQNRMSGVIIANCDMTLVNAMETSNKSEPDAVECTKPAAVEEDIEEALDTHIKETARYPIAHVKSSDKTELDAIVELHKPAAVEEDLEEAFDTRIEEETARFSIAPMKLPEARVSSVEEAEPGNIVDSETSDDDEQSDTAEPAIETVSSLSLERHEAMEPIDDEPEVVVTKQPHFLSFSPLVSAGNRSLTKLVNYTSTAYAYILLQLLFLCTVLKRLLSIK